MMRFHQPGPATVMRRGRLRLVPFTGQRTDKAQRRRLYPRPSVFTSIAPPALLTHLPRFNMGWPQSRPISPGTAEFILSECFLSAPPSSTPHPWGSTCNCSALMRTAKCHLAPQLQPWVHCGGGGLREQEEARQGGRLLLSSHKSASSLGEKEF